MAKQAKVLTAQELRRVLDYVATRKHADRNRAIILTMLNEAIQVRNFACRNFW
jgi:integrase/recombinase XerD